MPRIVHLLDAPEARPLLVRWFVEAWAPWYGPEGDGDAEADLAACDSRDRVPLCLVALGPNGAPRGTAMLRAESVGRELGAGPWLSALLVAETHRRQGIGRALIEAVVAEARRLGFEALYTSSELEREKLWPRSWQPIGDSRSLRGPISVYRLDL